LIAVVGVAPTTLLSAALDRSVKTPAKAVQMAIGKSEVRRQKSEDYFREQSMSNWF
jgi:hypothetical protein